MNTYLLILFTSAMGGLFGSLTGCTKLERETYRAVEYPVRSIDTADKVMIYVDWGNFDNEEHPFIESITLSRSGKISGADRNVFRSDTTIAELILNPGVGHVVGYIGDAPAFRKDLCTWMQTNMPMFIFRVPDELTGKPFLKIAGLANSARIHTFFLSPNAHITITFFDEKLNSNLSNNVILEKVVRAFNIQFNSIYSFGPFLVNPGQYLVRE